MFLAELGSVFLLISLGLSIVSFVTGLIAGSRGDPRLGRLARRAFYAAAGGLVGASATLVAALLAHDFSIAYVWEHTDRALSVPLTVAAFYGGQEGSLLYWALLLSLGGSAALAAADRASYRMTAFATAVLAAVATFFVLVLTFVASPFDVLPVAPADGLGLNPVLRD